jgi:ABC-2 type transport system permease protein
MLTIFRVMLLALIRDRGALAMAFLLPPLIFVVLAAVFAGASGENLQLRVGVATLVDDAPTRQLVERLAEAQQLELERLPDPAEVRARLASGRIDVGLIAQASLENVFASTSPLLIIADPGKPIAAPLLARQLQQLIEQELPQLALMRTLATVEPVLGGLTPGQRQRVAALAEAPLPSGPATAPLLTLETVAARPSNGVSYYAGAVAMLFLLFSAMQGAASLVDEQRTGVMDRLLIGPGGTDVIVLGKALFLWAQGMLQVTLIFFVAWFGYGVGVASNFAPWLITTGMAALAATGLALAVAVSCRTRQQVQTLTTFLVLVLSAVGGSMVPRFLMPQWLQQLGWLTPNAWGVEAYQSVLWRSEPLSSVAPAWGVLAATGILGVLVALMVARRQARA